MRLKDFKRPRRDGEPFIGTLTDSVGATHYELAISGSPKLIQQAFAESELEYIVDPKATESNWVPRFQNMWMDKTGKRPRSEQPETIKALSKRMPPAASAKNSIVVSLRRTQGQGTWWAFWWPALSLPAGASLFFVLPPICNCSGVVVPISGDPDLFLSANGPFNPIIAASTLGVGAIDSVAFGPAICWPWQEFVPWFRVRGFTKCVTAFGMTGFGVVP
jgi:hypothetical protein